MTDFSRRDWVLRLAAGMGGALAACGRSAATCPEDMPALATLSGLDALTSVGGGIEIRDNELSSQDITAFFRRLRR